jgi:molybdopterin molybdotransferase
MISFSQAQSKLRELCETWVSEVGLAPESRSLSSSLGFYLSDDICAAQNIPRETISAMDGYALCMAGDADNAKAHSEFQVCGESRAGKPYSGAPLGGNQCLRIMTGAVVPHWADTVIIQENTQKVADNKIVLLQDITVGKNIRRCGEDINQGQILFKQYQPITPSIVSALASQGIGSVNTFRKLKVGFFATGDELKAAGDSLSCGDIYESNLSAIAALIGGLPVKYSNLGVIKDSKADIELCLEQAAQHFDVVISSGGISVGDYDYVKDCVESMGKLDSYKVALKPGKPLCFGVLGDKPQTSTLFFGLPGNAVSSFVTLSEFFLPALRFLVGGRESPQKLQLMATLKNTIHKSSQRLEFQRGVLSSQVSSEGDISWQVTTFSEQDSHLVYGLAQANCMITLSENSGALQVGDRVKVTPFAWCFNG